MSSLLFSSKLSLGKQAQTPIRMLSTTTNPYLMYRVTACGEEFQEAGVMTELHIFDPAKEENFSVGDKPFPKEMVESNSFLSFFF
ncbi:unnamed protein product [Arabis nemorensis]|uniref:Uncharacterized protein n=1 Tax=Arabis nemorensis TaxID=586526 RepID=A0A565B715_9BRAS|nr:unnamed protein product [Arabis nemorensis]